MAVAHTNHYQLELPDETEKDLRSFHNTNMDLIDAAIYDASHVDSSYAGKLLVINANGVVVPAS